MSYHTKKTDRMDIHIEEYRGTILVQQKWKYSWVRSIGVSNWTYKEKKTFHNKVDNLIWNKWGKRFFLKVNGTSEFAKKHKNTRWDVNFDIKWSLDKEHWNVKVKKIPSGHFSSSSVQWSAKKISLDTNDFKKRKTGKKFYQYPVVHEFGHAVGNSIYASKGMHGDEYKSTSTYFSDKNSLMNIGSILRDRHLDYLLKQLNTMLPNTNFSKY